MRIFRLDENGKRLQSSCDGIMMAKLPLEKFEEAVIKVVKLNSEFIPPYETGASLYIRPMLIGMGAQVGVKPASEYLFVVFVTPVGPYFKGGFMGGVCQRATAGCGFQAGTSFCCPYLVA